MNGKQVKSIKYDLIKGGLPFGCKVSGGKIVPAYSTVGFNTQGPKNVLFAAYMHGTDRIYAVNDTSLYSAGENGTYTEIMRIQTKMPFAFENRDETRVVSRCVLDTYHFYCKDNLNVLSKAHNYNIGAGIYKNGRVFAVDLNDTRKIRWTGENGLEDWAWKIDGNGWLYTDTELGGIYNLIAFKGDIAALKKYGICLVSADGTPEDFKEILTLPTVATYRNCAVVCGNKLYFYTEDGLYAFNGTTAEKVNVELAKDFTSAVYSMTYGTCVFFAGKHKKLEKGVIFVYDTEDNSAYFIDVAPTAMVAGNSLYAYTPTGIATLGKGTAFTYESQEFGFFSSRKKTLKSIFIDCDIGVDLTVKTDRGSRVFEGVRGEVPVRMGGHSFTVEVTGANSEIKALTASVEYY